MKPTGECVMYAVKFVLEKEMYKWVKHGFAFTSLSQKDSLMKWKRYLSGQEKVLEAAVSKVDHIDRLLGYENTHQYWFPWKRFNDYQCFLL